MRLHEHELTQGLGLILYLYVLQSHHCLIKWLLSKPLAKPHIEPSPAVPRKTAQFAEHPYNMESNPPPSLPRYGLSKRTVVAVSSESNASGTMPNDKRV